MHPFLPYIVITFSHISAHLHLNEIWITTSFCTDISLSMHKKRSVKPTATKLNATNSLRIERWKLCEITKIVDIFFQLSAKTKNMVIIKATNVASVGSAFRGETMFRLGGCLIDLSCSWPEMTDIINILPYP